MEQRRMDYHLHTTHSMDGEQTMEELCRTMVERGVQEICLTDHIEPGYPDPEMDKPPVWKDWFADIERCRAMFPQLEIKAGIEIGDNPEIRDQVKRMVDELPLDFRLLSLHLVGGLDPFNADYWEKYGREDGYRAYAKEKADSICAWTDFDSIAHIGYVAKFAPFTGEERPFRYEDAPEDIERLLKHVIACDKCIEVNTSGYARTGYTQPHPSILKRYIELGGEIFTFGSDSHNTERDYADIERAKQLVRELGGKYQASFTQRKRTLYRI